MKTKTWLLLIAVLAVLCAILTAVLFHSRPASVALIYQDNQLLSTVSLQEDQTFRIEYGDGYNVVTIRDGEIFVSEASCPDQICVAHGPASGGAPIVCLPNRLVIRFEGDDDKIDGISG